jgi:hypothetical protein
MIKIVLGLVILWSVFFGQFIVNGGMCVFKSQYFRAVTLEVPYNSATALRNITILTTNATAFTDTYRDYSYEQIVLDLNCSQNRYSPAAQAPLDIYINNNRPTQCFFGFLYLILFSACYIVVEAKFDLPTLMTKKHRTKEKNGMYLHLLTFFIEGGLLFCFFSIFVFEYIVQSTPCLGIKDSAYPQFTAVETLLNGEIGNPWVTQAPFL